MSSSHVCRSPSGCRNHTVPGSCEEPLRTYHVSPLRRTLPVLRPFESRMSRSFIRRTRSPGLRPHSYFLNPYLVAIEARRLTVDKPAAPPRSPAGCSVTLSIASTGTASQPRASMPPSSNVMPITNSLGCDCPSIASSTLNGRRANARPRFILRRTNDQPQQIA